jgi:23S rRNA (uridine2552-2'-O)-methyltransferase
MKRREYKRDRYQKRAKKEGYRSRAVYKLIQINDTYSIFRKSDTVLDLGAAPGGWSQVARELVGDNGTVIGIDIHKIHEIDGVTFLKGDITDDETFDTVLKVIDSADVVLSDVSPHISGQSTLDHARSIDLAEHALTFAEKMLKQGGILVVKVFQGEMLGDYMEKVKEKFVFCKGHSPRASRVGSSELYIVAKGFRK